MDYVQELEEKVSALESQVEALREALTWIATVNAMDYEYVKMAKETLLKENKQ